MSDDEQLQPHGLDCAKRIRRDALVGKVDEVEPTLLTLQHIASSVRSCCGHSLLKSHRLAWGWTAAQAVDEFHRMCDRNGYERRGLSRRSWLEWEAGRLPNRSYRDLVCQLFSTGPVQLGFARDYTPDEEPARQPPEPGTEPERRLVVADSEAVALFGNRIVGSLTDDAALDHMEAEIQRISSAFVSQPLMDILPDLRMLRAGVFTCIEQCRFPKQMRRLYFAASQVCGLHAHVFLDVGNYSASASAAQVSWLCADLAGDRSMQAWIRSVQSLIAYWDGRPTQAAELASDGAAYSAPGSISSRLAALQARALSAVGDIDGALAALASAERTTPDTADGEAGLFHFPAAKQAAYAGTTLIGIGDRPALTRAIGESSRAIELYRAGPDTDRSSGDTQAACFDLATSHLLLGELDGASHYLDAVLSVPPAQRTASIVKRGNQLRHRLADPRYAGSVVGTALLDRLADFCQQAASSAAVGYRSPAGHQSQTPAR